MTQPEPPPALDWTQLRARLEQLQRSGDSRELSPEQADALLRERARVLAPAPAQQRDQGEETVVFRVGDARYGLPSRRVREVVHLAGWTRLPGARPPLLGVAGWRGELLTVLDLASALGHSATPAAATWALVLHRDGEPLGLPVAEVQSVEWLREDEVRATGVDDGRVRGLTAGGVAVLDEAWLDHFSRTTP